MCGGEGLSHEEAMANPLPVALRHVLPPSLRKTEPVVIGRSWDGLQEWIKPWGLGKKFLSAPRIGINSISNNNSTNSIIKLKN